MPTAVDNWITDTPEPSPFKDCVADSQEPVEVKCNLTKIPGSDATTKFVINVGDDSEDSETDRSDNGHPVSSNMSTGFWDGLTWYWNLGTARTA